MILKNSSPYAQVSNILFRKERQNWKPIYSGCPDAPLFNQEKSKLMQTKGQLSKNQSCFFVCTTFDSFLNDLSLTSKSIIPHLYEFFYHFDYTHNLMTSWILAEKEKLPSTDSSFLSVGTPLGIHNVIQYNLVCTGSNVIHLSKNPNLYKIQTFLKTAW